MIRVYKIDGLTAIAEISIDTESAPDGALHSWILEGIDIRLKSGRFVDVDEYKPFKTVDQYTEFCDAVTDKIENEFETIVDEYNDELVDAAADGDEWSGGFAENH